MSLRIQVREAVEGIRTQIAEALDGGATLPATLRAPLAELVAFLDLALTALRSPRGMGKARLHLQQGLALLADPTFDPDLSGRLSGSIREVLALVPAPEACEPEAAPARKPRRKAARKAHKGYLDPIPRYPTADPTPGATPDHESILDPVPGPGAAPVAQPSAQPAPALGGVEVRFIHGAGGWRADMTAADFLGLLARVGGNHG